MSVFQHFSVVCLECGKPCTGPLCPHACTGAATITRRLVRTDKPRVSEPSAHECEACGTKTIHDIVAGNFEVCRACGFARRSTPRNTNANAT